VSSPLAWPAGVRAVAVYHFEGCSYCTRVRAAAARLDLTRRGLALEWRDIDAHDQHRRALARARGRTTVPVLRIERDDAPDVWMPESLDIVTWLESVAEGTAVVPDAPLPTGWLGRLRRLWPL
jgi:glutaredoxin